MTQVHISTTDANVVTDEVSEEQAGEMFVVWRLAAERGPDIPVSFAAMDEQGHRITLCVRSGDIRSMHWVDDDDPLLLKERMLRALGVDKDASPEPEPEPEADDGCGDAPDPEGDPETGEMDIDAYDGSGD